jgi:soluble lytic murein transglycosylase
VLEATQVYRARLNNGSAPLNLSGDLKRGGYSYMAQAPSPPPPPAVPPIGGGR